MATAILFKNADLYAPEHKGIKQILTVNDKIIAVEDEISADLPGLEVIDLNGAIVTPGLIDQHIHVTGGGGEGGPLTRAPELNFSELVDVLYKTVDNGQSPPECLWRSPYHPYLRLPVRYRGYNLQF